MKISNKGIILICIVSILIIIVPVVISVNLTNPSKRQDQAVELCQEKFAYIEDVTAFKGVSSRTLCLDVSKDNPTILGILEN